MIKKEYIKLAEHLILKNNEKKTPLSNTYLLAETCQIYCEMIDRIEDVKEYYEHVCLLTKGKGRIVGNLPDEAGVYLFKSENKAKLFKQKNEDLDSKYWTKIDIVEPDTNIEIGYP